MPSNLSTTRDPSSTFIWLFFTTLQQALEVGDISSVAHKISDEREEVLIRVTRLGTTTPKPLFTMITWGELECMAIDVKRGKS